MVEKDFDNYRKLFNLNLPTTYYDKDNSYPGADRDDRLMHRIRNDPGIIRDQLLGL